jgi:hypothetical protein
MIGTFQRSAFSEGIMPLAPFLAFSNFYSRETFILFHRGDILASGNVRIVMLIQII